MRKPHEWWTRTWNPITGCTRVSAGCANCYAHAMHRRFWRVTRYAVRSFGELQFHPERLYQPRTWRNPQVVFVGSMTDMFHEQVQDDWFLGVWDAMRSEPQHIYVLLTKRPERIDCMLRLLWGSMLDRNIYIGVSVEDQRTAEERIPALVQAWSGPKVVSYEPALGPVRLGPLIKELSGVIAGAETGPRARPANPEWFRELRNECATQEAIMSEDTSGQAQAGSKAGAQWAQTSAGSGQGSDAGMTLEQAYARIRELRNECAEASVPFFLKQVNAKRERLLDGRTSDELPWSAIGGPTGMPLRAYYLFLEGADRLFLCHAYTAREAKRRFASYLRDYYEELDFRDVRVLRARRYDARSAMFTEPTFDTDANPHCDKCGLWECDGGADCAKGWR